MQDSVPAIYEGGLLRPLVPLALPEGAEVALRIVPPAHVANVEREERLARQKLAIDKILRDAKELPPEGIDDGFSGADHDSILYGSP